MAVLDSLLRQPISTHQLCLAQTQLSLLRLFLTLFLQVLHPCSAVAKKSAVFL